MTAAAAAQDELSRIAAQASAAESNNLGAAPTSPPPITDPNAPPQLAPAPAAPTGDVLAGMLAPAFMVLAPNWSVSMDECRALGQAWGGVIDHYYPGGLQAMGPWGSALLVTAAVLGPRVAMRVPPRRVPRPDKPQAPKPAQESAPEPAAPPLDPTAEGTPRRDASAPYDA